MDGRLQIQHPQFAGIATMAIEPLDDVDTDRATAQTIRRMVEYSIADSEDDLVRRAASDVAARLNARDGRQLAAAVHNWIRQRVRFQPDEKTAAPIPGASPLAEVLIRPADLLRMKEPAGDCDDFSMLCAAMLRALGIRSSFKTIAAEPAMPDTFSHVYVIAHTNQGDIALDCSHGAYPGWEAPSSGKTRLWSVEMNSPQLGAIDWGSLLKIGADTGATIAKNRWGQPPEGTYVQNRDSVFYRQPAGQSALAFPGVGVNVGSSGSTGTLLLIAGVAVMVILLTRSK